MNIVDKFSSNAVKILMTPIELMQAIANLSAQNAQGQHDQRIALYTEMLEKHKSTHINAPTRAEHIPQRIDSAAIMHFNRDMRFSINE
jgi:hypothetical protein